MNQSMRVKLIVFIVGFWYACFGRVYIRGRENKRERVKKSNEFMKVKFICIINLVELHKHKSSSFPCISK